MCRPQLAQKDKGKQKKSKKGEKRKGGRAGKIKKKDITHKEKNQREMAFVGIFAL